MATSLSGGDSRREPPTMGKQLVSFITCGCESCAPFFVDYKAGGEATPIFLMILCEEVPILLYQQMILPNHRGICKAI